MIKKKLVFTEADRREIKRLKEELNRIVLDSGSLSPIYAGGCGEQCMVTCAHYCEFSCEIKCKKVCDNTCLGMCDTSCSGTCGNNWMLSADMSPYIY